MGELACGCKFRKILKEEKKDYPEGTEFMMEELCSLHKDDEGLR